jgi:hypothetical protein
MKKTDLILFILLVLCFCIRVIVGCNTYVISSDGPFYIEVAQYFAEGDYKSALLKQTNHPLYPFLIAIAQKFISNWEWAGLLVSIIFSTLAIIPLYSLGKRYFPLPIVILSCVLYCFHPSCAKLSASLLTTGVFIGTFLFALWVTQIALETNRHFYFLLAGFLSFIMYLIRPDGFIFWILTIIGIIVNPNLSQHNVGTIHPNSAGQFKKRLLSILILLIPWILLLTPYLFVLYKVTGNVSLSTKADIKRMLGQEEEDGISVKSALKEKAPVRKYLIGLYLLVVYFIKGANPLPFLLFLIGAICPSGSLDRQKKPFFIWLVFIGFLLVFFRYAGVHERLSTRYTVPIFMMMILWAGWGLYYLVFTLCRFIPLFSRKSEIFYYLSAGLVVIFLSIYTFEPVGKTRLIEKKTGEFIRQYHSAQGLQKTPLIITLSNRIPYYAKGKAIVPQELGRNYSKLADTIIEKRIDYLVIDSRIQRQFPEIENEIERYRKNNSRVSGTELLALTQNKPLDSYKVFKFSIATLGLDDEKK